VARSVDRGRQASTSSKPGFGDRRFHAGASS
jgi:hypothetical protein